MTPGVAEPKLYNSSIRYDLWKWVPKSQQAAHGGCADARIPGDAAELSALAIIEFEPRCALVVCVTMTTRCWNGALAMWWARRNRRGNLYPTKQRPDQKIDAALAMMMALGRAMTEDSNAGIDDFLSNPLIL